MDKHTPKPWRWEVNMNSKSISLVGGRPTFDKEVMCFDRWGMRGATPLFNAEIAGDQYNEMCRVADRPDWMAPSPGREHHAGLLMNVTHPDARLIAAAPELLAALKEVLAAERATATPPRTAMQAEANLDRIRAAVAQAEAAIAKATGEQT